MQRALKNTRHGNSRLFATIALLLLLLVAVPATDAALSRRAAALYPPPGAFVAVDGRAMHYVCQGDGAPTVVLLAGIGGDSLDWQPVMPALAESSRVCAFDRFGQGWSDPMAPSADLGAAVDELHAALTALAIEQPFIAGHSLGGAIAQLYAARYPVSGVVLVDGLSADVAEPVLDRMGRYQSLIWAARLGWLRPMGAALSPPAYDPALRREMRALRSRAGAIEQMAREGAAAATTGASALVAAEPALHAPLLIIAAGQSNVVPGQPPGAFADALAALAMRHADASFHLIPEAHHYVQAEQPDVVADLIARFVRAQGAS